MLKLKLQYFGYLMQRANSLEKTLMMRKIEVRRRRGWQRMRWLDSITELIGMILSKPGSCWWTGKPGMLSPWGHWELDMTEWLNWICLLRIIKKKKIYWDLMHKIIVTIYCICIFVHIEYSALGRLKKKIISEYGCSSMFYCKESWIYVNRERIAIGCKELWIMTHYSSLIGFKVCRR